METLVNRCRRLVAVTKTDYVRYIYNHINWNCRLLSIRGARGVGKTTLMLQYLKLHDIDKQRGHPSVAGMKAIADQVIKYFKARSK